MRKFDQNCNDLCDYRNVINLRRFFFTSSCILCKNVKVAIDNDTFPHNSHTHKENGGKTNMTKWKYG